MCFYWGRRFNGDFWVTPKIFSSSAATQILSCVLRTKFPTSTMVFIFLFYLYIFTISFLALFLCFVCRLVCIVCILTVFFLYGVMVCWECLDRYKHLYAIFCCCSLFLSQTLVFLFLKIPMSLFVLGLTFIFYPTSAIGLLMNFMDCPR